jgi:enoyl-CoA hydratase/carnithine racemase
MVFFEAANGSGGDDVSAAETRRPDERVGSSGWEHFRLEQRTPSHWRVTFDHPPINTITATTVAELAELIDLIEASPELNVVVFDSANPDFFLAHYDTENEPQRTLALPPGPTGMNAWLDVLVRLSRAPAVSVAAIRGRARGAGSEFALACDMRFAATERALLGQFEVGLGLVPGGGPMARLARLVGRGRALEIVVGGDDFDGARAELYGYVNRSVPDAELDATVDALADRLAVFEHEALARIKGYIDAVTLPEDSELPPALEDFFALSVGSRQQAMLAEAQRLGLNVPGDMELRLGTRIVEVASQTKEER